MTQALAIIDPLAFGQENNTMHFANGRGIIRFTEIQHVRKEDRNRYTLLNENREVFLHVHLEFANVLRLESFLFSPIFNLVGAITPSSENDAHMFPEHLFVFAREVLLVFFQVLSCRLLVSIGGVDEDYEEMGILYMLSEFFHHFDYVFLVGIDALVQTGCVHHSQLYLLLKFPYLKTWRYSDQSPCEYFQIVLSRNQTLKNPALGVSKNSSQNMYIDYYYP